MADDSEDPKEWYLAKPETNGVTALYAYNFPTSGATRVIEYSAYETAVQKLEAVTASAASAKDQAKSDLDSVIAEHAANKEELLALRVDWKKWNAEHDPTTVGDLRAKVGEAVASAANTVENLNAERTKSDRFIQVLGRMQNDDLTDEDNEWIAAGYP